MSIVKRKPWLALLPALTVCCTTTLYAGEHDHRDHDAHEHGVGQLNIAVEKNQLHIELTSPAMNIVGFEHQPRDEKQHTAVEQAVAKLKAAEQLFITSTSASCTLKEAEVETSLMKEHDEHEHHDHDHGHKHEHEHAEEEAHADFVAHYAFECAKPDQLSDISVKLFEAFPATEELEVQLLNGAKQSAMELNATKARIAF